MSSFSKLVRQLEKASDNWSLARLMEQKNPEKRKGLRIEHPRYGRGTVSDLTENYARISWDARNPMAPRMLTRKAAASVVVEMFSVNDLEVKGDRGSVSSSTFGKGSATPLASLSGEGKTDVRDEHDNSVPKAKFERLTPPKGNQGKPSKVKAIKESDEAAKTSNAAGGIMNPDSFEDFSADFDEPLSVIDGLDDFDSFGLEDSFVSPDDAPDVPDFDTEEHGDASASFGGGQGGGQGGEKSSSEDGDEPSEDESSEDDAAEAPAEDADDKDESPQDRFKKIAETMTFEDIDPSVKMQEKPKMKTTKVMKKPVSEECGMGAKKQKMEHDMSSGDIAVSRDFLYRLIIAAVDAQLSEDRIRLVLDAIEENATSDRTLGVEDIATVMSSLRNKVDGGNIPLDKDTGDGKMTPDDETILMDSLKESCGKRLKTMNESVVVAINPTAEELRTIDKLRAQGVEVVVANSQEELDELMAQHGGVVANNSRGRMDDLTRDINRNNSPRGSRLRNQRDFVDAAVKARDMARGDQLDESFLGIASIKPTVRVDSLEDEFGAEFHQMADENDIDDADIRAAKKAAGLKYW